MISEYGKRLQLSSAAKGLAAVLMLSFLDGCVINNIAENSTESRSSLVSPFKNATDDDSKMLRKGKMPYANGRRLMNPDSDH